MVKLQRLGIVLEPEWKEPKTFAKFNAGMVLDGDSVHMLYRYSAWKASYDPDKESNYAMDDIRYAKLTPEGKLVYEAKKPLISPSLAWDYSGCQDPRIIPFEGAYYIFYCGWDKDIAKPGMDRPRVCVARTHDFKTAEKLGVINNYRHDKDAFIFPERINGKIAYVHRIAPNIQIEYFDTFEEMLDPRTWENYKERVEESTVMRAAFPWECGKVGGSLPPIRTDKGWLFIYHAVETFPDRHFIYRAGAALLDLENPSKVVARLPYPILEPEEDYELYGDVDNVVFPVGGYQYNGDLYVSYGGADRCVALAKVSMYELIEELIKYTVE